MVKINIKKSRKFTEFEYSLFITFDFDIKIVSQLRKLTYRYFHTESNCWEVPSVHYEAVLKILNGTQFVITNKELLEKNMPDYEFKTTPYNYQLEGIKFGLSKNRFHLGDEQGLGKTKQCIDLACIQKQKKGIQHCLIICGVATLRWNWRDEIETHSNEDHCILGLRKRKRKNTMYDGGTTAKIEDLQSIPEAFFWIINVEALRDETIIKILKKYHENGIIGIIITDEVHKIKNPLSAQGKGYLKVVNIKDTEDIRITISGTPLINQPMDLYMIFKSLGYENNSYTAFKNHYCLMGGYMNREIIGYQNLQELKNRLKNIQIRRLKKDVLELPEKLPQTIYVELAKEQMDLYQEVRIALQDKVDLIKLNPNPLAQFTRLRQVTGTPQLISSTVSKSTKLDRLVELVDEIADRGEQCLIFSNWAEVCKIIVDRLKSVNALGYISGCKDLKSIETEFKANPNHVALVGTIKLMGTGLTFNNSNNVIFFDSPWTDADKQQAIDRCHRIGQTSDLNIYTLVCANTIDEKVEKIIQRKHILSDGIVDGGNVMKLEQLINLLLS